MNASEPPFTSSEEPYLYDDNYEEDAPGPCNKDAIRKFGAQFLPVLYSLVFVFGLLGNALVVCVLIQYKRLKSMTDVYLLNLAISDLLFVFSLPFWIYYAVDEWVFGNGLCKIISGFYLVGFYSGIFFITLMSIDRYLAIVHAIFAMRARTVNYGTITSIAIWAIAFLASIPELVFNEVLEEQNRTSCQPKYPDPQKTWTMFFSLEINILGLVIPSAVMIFCYSMIIKTLLRCKNEKKIKAVKLIFAVMIVFFVFWTPYNVVLFLHVLKELELISKCGTIIELDYSLQVTETLAFVHCCLNPIIYVFLGEKFRKYLKLLLQKCSMFLFHCNPCQVFHIYLHDSLSSSHTQSTQDCEHYDGL